MSFDFVNLPANAVAVVGPFLEYKTIIRLRQVSKSACKLVDNRILSNNVDLLILKLKNQSETKSRQEAREIRPVALKFIWMRDDRSRDVWRNAATCILRELGYTHVLFENFACEMGFSMNVDELAKFLEYAKTIIGTTQFRFFRIESIQPEVASIFSVLLRGKTVPVVIIHCCDDDKSEGFPSIIKQLSPRCINFQFDTLTKESAQFLLKLSGITKMIVFAMRNSTVNMFELVRAIVNGTNQCQYLEICKYERSANPQLTFVHAEKIIQFLLHSEKKAHLAIEIDDMASIFTQIGSHDINISNGFFTIEHLK